MFRILKILFLAGWILFLFNIPQATSSADKADQNNKYTADQGISFYSEQSSDLLDYDTDFTAETENSGNVCKRIDLQNIQLIHVQNSRNTQLSELLNLFNIDIPPPVAG